MVKLEMYQDQVFCFTPKGDVIKLPRGATPIDFAYAIHTRIGAACVGAKIDGLRVPLWTRVKNGQSVDIITAEGQTPQATWIDIAVTGRAKTAIRKALREEDRTRMDRGLLDAPRGEDFCGIGCQFGNAFKDLWHNFKAIFTHEKMDWMGLGDFFDRVFYPYFVGGIIPGIITATIAYYLSVPVIKAYQNRRRLSPTKGGSYVQIATRRKYRSRGDSAQCAWRQYAGSRARSDFSARCGGGWNYRPPARRPPTHRCGTWQPLAIRLGLRSTQDTASPMIAHRRGHVMRIAALLFATFFATPIAAQVAGDCGWQARADTIVEPWEDNTATFANGAVRVALLDVAEPAAAAFYLLILHPPVDELGVRTCTVVGLDEDLGYAAVFFEELQADYDAAVGLTLTVPAIIYLPEQSFQNSAALTISVNQSTGDVVVTQALGNE
ncbi:GTP pyrophosphokinase rsh [Nymphon striatum]|nr:GTP pyrophosphokinase rsh [Nymphon striatum]